MQFNWQANGSSSHECYFGRLYVGSVHRMIPENWESMVGVVPPERTKWYRSVSDRPWRAWVMSDEDGSEAGRFASVDEGKRAVELAATELIGDAAASAR